MKMESVDNRATESSNAGTLFFFKSTVTTMRQLRCGNFNNAQGKTLGHITHFSSRL